MKKFRFIVNVLIIGLLITESIYSSYRIFSNSYGLTVQHYLGFSLTFLTLFSLFYNRNIFILLLGINLVVGNFCELTIFIGMETGEFIFYFAKLPIPLYWGQPFYSFVLFIYILFNKGFYIGILSNSYWPEFLNRKEDLKTDVITITTDRKDN
jgi:hypothetical protein